MTKYTRRLAASLIASAALLAGCHGGDKKTDTTALGTDTTLNRDLAMANRDTTAQPQLKDVPANAPATTTPNPPATTERPATHTTPRVIHRPAQSGPVNRAENKPAPAPTSTTTRSGNTATTNPGAASNPGSTGGGAVGMIPAGATLNTHSNSRV
ncbi:MAG TPA: hypothetical protein VH277_02370, partial [Gemmatimonadaceae bacterium]|nr:hypothetical protein [Gemmatimonadaceae bacterium]